MEKIDYKNIKYFKIIISLVICEIMVLAPKLYIIQKTVPFTDIADEVAMLSVPAYFAGYNWKEITDNLSYYGFGYFIFFAPLFKAGLDTVVIYKIILIITSVLEEMIPLILYNILIKHFNICSSVKLMLISTMVSFLTVNPLYNIINEHILIILVWAIVFFLIKLLFVCEKKIKSQYTILLLLAMVYGLFIHTRFIALVIAVFLGIILYRIVFKEWLVNKALFALFPVGYFVANVFIKNIQNLVWGKTELVNASINVNFAVGNNIKDFVLGNILLFIGNIGTMQIFFLGCCFLMLFSLIYYIYFSFHDKTHSKLFKIYFLISVIFIFCTGITLLGIMFQNRERLLLNINDKNEYSIKYLTYLRYYILYTSPLFFLGCVLLLCEKHIFEKIYKLAFMVETLVMYIWLIYISPIISDTYFGASTFYPFSYLLKLKAKLSLDDIRGIAIIVFNLSVLLILLLKNKKNNWAFLLLTTLFIYRYVYFAENIANPIARKYYQEIDKSIEYINEIKDDINKIYVYSKNRTLPFMYQAYLYDIKILTDIPENLESGDILISDQSISNIKEDWKEINLDKNEWIYINPEKQAVLAD